MKNKLISILKLNIKNAFKINKIKQEKKPKLIFLGLFIIYIALVLIFSIGYYSYNLFQILKSVNLINIYIPIILILTSSISFIFMIYSTKQTLFDSKDNDLLLSLPIKTKDILLSRLISVYSYTLILSLIILIPSLSIYIYFINPSIIFYIIILFTIIFLPIIPTILSSFVGYLLAFISSKTNFKQLFEMLYYLIFLVIYFYTFNNDSKIINIITTNQNSFAKVLKYLFFPINSITIAINNNNLLYLILYILINIILVILIITIFNKSYFNIISNLQNKKTKKIDHINIKKTNSIKKTLFLKELKRFLSSPVYIYNTSFGVVLLFIVSIISIFKDKEVLQMINADVSIYFTILLMISFILSLTSSTSSSISIEGNNLWILKTLPVKEEDILNNKLYVNYLIAMPLTIISLIMFKIAAFINLKEMFTLILYSIIFILVISHFGLLINLKFPKLDAKNDSSIVKRSMSSTISILVPMLCVMIILPFLFSLNINGVTLTLLITIVLLIVFIILRIILNKYGIKRFKEL